MDRFGRVALKPLYCFILGEGGKLPATAVGSLRLRTNILHDLTPRILRGVSPDPYCQVDSDATGLGHMATSAFLQSSDGKLFNSCRGH